MPTQTTLPLQSVLPGRGGSQHKYLQQLIKRWGECKGYRVTVEKQIFDGLGAVDVALENEKRKIACEICVNSTPERELGNIQKCLAAGFEYVVSMSNEKKTLASLKELVSAKLSEKEMKQVRFLTPGELFSFVESIEADSASKQETVRGYRVKVQYKPVGEQEKQGRKKAISDVIMRALKKLKKSKPRADA